MNPDLLLPIITSLGWLILAGFIFTIYFGSRAGARAARARKR